MEDCGRKRRKKWMKWRKRKKKITRKLTSVGCSLSLVARKFI